MRSILIISVILLIAGAIAGIIVAIVCAAKKKKKATSAKKCDGAQNAEYVPFADDCGREHAVDDIAPEKNDAPKENSDTQSETDDTQTEQSENQIAPGERSDVQASKDNGNDGAELCFFEPDEKSKETQGENGDTLSLW